MKVFKNKKILVGLILAVTTLTGLFIFLRKERVEKNNSPSPSPVSSQKTKTPLPSGKTLSIKNIKVKNFYQKENVSLGKLGEALFVDKQAYKITYYPDDQAFLITVLASPFETIRQAAEEEFLASLEINQAQACKLDVFITTPYSVNPNYAGQNHRLSFCQ